ncbi:MAG: prenyltransferase/squalene oxidase repeat-containing protein [Planctomycetota bacterium]
MRVTSLGFGSWAGRLAALVSLCVATAWAPGTLAMDEARRAAADRAIERGVAYLLSSQAEDGSWMPQPGPAVTALGLRALLAQPDIGPDHPAAAKALRYVLDRAQPDGSISEGMLANYNTAISISALALLPDNPEAKAAKDAAVAYLRSLQWDAGMTLPDGTTVTAEHAFYGGAGYGRHGRPDLSNTHFLVQAYHDAGLAGDDPAIQRAVAYVERCQGLPDNAMHGAAIASDGGFIYATSINKDLVGVPESKANPELMEQAQEMVAQGVEPAVVRQRVVGLRTYGSMTYAGFKSYVYADLERDDPRVLAALGWIARNWTLDRNPGMPEAFDQQGLYYMYMTLGRALSAWGEDELTLSDGRQVNWANELVDALVQRQQEDGSWVNGEDRWMEGSPDLVTCYTLLALIEARDAAAE